MTVSDYDRFDEARVRAFLGAFDDFTWAVGPARRTAELDSRIERANLTLADKIEAFRRFAKTGWQSARDELRMECLIRSVAPEDLSVFKYALEYDGDYKDLEEYLCHDIDDQKCRQRVVEHLGAAPDRAGVKVLSDVDDTMYPNLFDERYPRNTAGKSFYPGLVEFYDALKKEPFGVAGIPMTTLSARPNPVAGIAEEASLRKLVEYSGDRFRPSALSGALVSSTIGTLQTFARTRLGEVIEHLPHGQEDEIGITKFKNFANFAAVYPEYRYVFVGDSGQADALTARLMLDASVTPASSRVVTTFIHDLRRSPDDHASPAFRGLSAGAIVTRSSPAGRGVIVFRNYVEAALVAFCHAGALDDLITADDLARITRAALEQFRAIDFDGAGKAESRRVLADQYRADAEDAYRRLTGLAPGPASRQEDLRAIRLALDGGLAARSSTEPSTGRGAG